MLVPVLAYFLSLPLREGTSLVSWVKSEFPEASGLGNFGDWKIIWIGEISDTH